jgi:virulence-associated protein VagC
MPVAKIIEVDGGQAVELPEGFRFATRTVSIRKNGRAVVLEPMKPETWPPDFFDRIAIDDPTFVRPVQGDMPPAPRLD